jgi:hypothetical protein
MPEERCYALQTVLDDRVDKMIILGLVHIEPAFGVVGENPRFYLSPLVHDKVSIMAAVQRTQAFLKCTLESFIQFRPGIYDSPAFYSLTAHKNSLFYGLLIVLFFLLSRDEEHSIQVSIRSKAKSLLHTR